ncbi:MULTISPECIES: type IV pilin protein [Acinetobacter]|uniref:type IV pilin protein n=1 Tax=Acinetobacter TaxID=469 RepID=UPI000C50CD6A|nr:MULTISPECIES: type IV pilin protein [unclassified Acinetobacter]MBC67980.1 prepilin-type cleavage/methylation domain-containing protein [Acinetobacter sp.]MBT49552.1 prepilin-type cleavage/methylation domain-containing protein [Acinetobacter sp.]
MKPVFSLNKSHLGFTLIELMVVVVIVALLAAIALPSYQLYIQRSHLAQAQQEMQKLAEQLERHKAKNFSYKGFEASYLYRDKDGVLSSNFDTAKQQISLPIHSTNPSYRLSIIGFYTVSEFDEDDEGNVTSTIKDPEIKTDLLNKKIDFNKSTQADMFAIGSSWAIKAESLDQKNYGLLLNSLGTKCMNKKDYTKVSYTSCGNEEEGAESW